MEWWLVLLIIIGSLLVLFFSGLPVAFAFLVVNIIGIFLFWGGISGFNQLVISIRGSLASFVLLPIVLFVLMGVVLFHTGMALKAIEAMDQWLGRLPGRLALLAVAAGVLIGTLSGSSPASTGILGKALTPEMEKRGYKKAMSLGPIMASGGLAMLIPPSALSVFIAALAGTSVGAVLIGGAIPGLMLAVLYAGYIIIRCWLQPSIAPPYEVPPTSLSEKIMGIVKYVLPLAIVIFLVSGIILMGVATPSEAAATGTLGCIVLAACYGKWNWKLVKRIVKETIDISVMIYMIFTGSVAFAQILGFSGASPKLTQILVSLPVPPILVVIILQVALIFLGSFMSEIPLLMVIIPIFIPVIEAYGMSPVWFCLLLLVNIEMDMISPPYGAVLFVMKGVAPPDTTMGDIFRASLPWLAMMMIVMAIMLAFPQSVLWLPEVMK